MVGIVTNPYESEAKKEVLPCPNHNCMGNSCGGVGQFVEMVRRDLARYRCNVCGTHFRLDLRMPESALRDPDKLVHDKDLQPYRGYKHGQLKRPNLAVDRALNKFGL